MAPTQRSLKSFRALHLHLGAFTGALQSPDPHEAACGSGYKPAAWITGVAHMHKKQSFEAPAKRPTPNAAAVHARTIGAPARTDAKPSTPDHKPWPMKAFFVLVALSLLLSTLTGLCMGWRYTRDRRHGAILAAGIIVPALLMLI